MPKFSLNNDIKCLFLDFGFKVQVALSLDPGAVPADTVWVGCPAKATKPTPQHWHDLHYIMATSIYKQDGLLHKMYYMN